MATTSQCSQDHGNEMPITLLPVLQVMSVLVQKLHRIVRTYLRSFSGASLPSRKREALCEGAVKR